MATREEKVKERIKTGLRKYSKILQKAFDKNVNEADTRIIINNILSEVLGYDQFSEVSSEAMINKQFADYLLKVEKKPRLIVEAKQVGVELNLNHLRQASNYATDEGIEWIILTNGRVWNLYHIMLKDRSIKQLLFSVDILDKNVPIKRKVEFLYLLSKESIAKDILPAYWEKKCDFCPANVKKVLLSESVLKRVRLDLANLTGSRIDSDELRQLLIDEVIREDL